MTDRTTTPAEIKRRIVEALHDMVGASIICDEAAITVERDEVNPDVIHYTFPGLPVSTTYIEFVEYDEPVGCRR